MAVRDGVEKGGAVAAADEVIAGVQESTDARTFDDLELLLLRKLQESVPLSGLHRGQQVLFRRQEQLVEDVEAERVEKTHHPRPVPWGRVGVLEPAHEAHPSDPAEEGDDVEAVLQLLHELLVFLIQHILVLRAVHFPAFFVRSFPGTQAEDHSIGNVFL